MISCLAFKKKINEYINEPISDDFKESMEEHLENCISCKALYQDEMLIEQAFHEAISSNIKFNSSREDIMKSIDKNRYRNTKLNKLYFHMKKSAIIYASSAAVFICAITGGIYLYKSYQNKTHEIAMLSENPSFISQINYYTGSIINNNMSIKASDNSIVDTLPMPKLNSCSSNIKNLVLSMSEEDKKSWKLGFSDRGKIVIYNDAALLAYSYNGGAPKYYAGLNFSDIIGENPRVNLNFSPNGEYVLIENLNDIDQAENINMHIFSLSKNEFKATTIKRSPNSIYTWSNSSNYFASVDSTTQTIKLYDTKLDEDKTIAFTKGTIKNLFVSDYGDIIVEALTSNMDQTLIDKFLLKKENSYLVEEYYIPGAILAMRGEKVLYYNENNIYELMDSKNNLIKSLDSEFKLENITHDYAVFTDGICNYIYNYDKSIYKYMLSDTINSTMKFSKELNKLALFKKDGVTILYPESKDGKTEIGYMNDDAMDQLWFDNNNIVKLVNDNNSDNPMGILFRKVNINTDTTSQEKVVNILDLYNSYKKPLKLNTTAISKYEDAKKIFISYMDFLKDDSTPENYKIKDYEIKTLKLEYGKDNSFNFSIEYSVLPVKNNTYFKFIEKDSKGWCNKIYNYITVKIKNNSYYIDSISQ